MSESQSHQNTLQTREALTGDVLKAKQIMKHELLNIDLENYASQKSLVSVDNERNSKDLKIYAAVICVLFFLSLVANGALAVYTHRYTQIKEPCLVMANDVAELRSRNSLLSGSDSNVQQLLTKETVAVVNEKVGNDQWNAASIPLEDENEALPELETVSEKESNEDVDDLPVDKITENKSEAKIEANINTSTEQIPETLEDKDETTIDESITEHLKKDATQLVEE
eukprot:Awhi_evm1s2479